MAFTHHLFGMFVKHSTTEILKHEIEYLLIRNSPIRPSSKWSSIFQASVVIYFLWKQTKFCSWPYWSGLSASRDKRIYVAIVWLYLEISFISLTVSSVQFVRECDKTIPKICRGCITVWTLRIISCSNANGSHEMCFVTKSIWSLDGYTSKIQLQQNKINMLPNT